jgi:hypothetical protein
MFAADGPWPTTVLKVVSGIRITLSGGADGWDWGGAPTFWKRESAWGRSTTPATVTMAGGAPVRPMLSLSPGATRRFAAVCWANNTPVGDPLSCRISPGNV